MSDEERAPPRVRTAAAERIRAAILTVRGMRVMLDAELAVLYGVETRTLIQAVKRNARRFPADFMFRLTVEEARRSRSQIVILNDQPTETTQESRATTPPGQRGGNLKHLPYAFTEQGVAMLSSVLRSDQSIDVNIEIMRTFVGLRRLLESNADLARKLDALESKYRKHDAQFRLVFDTIRELMAADDATDKPRIGFGREDAGSPPRK